MKAFATLLVSLTLFTALSCDSEQQQAQSAETMMEAAKEAPAGPDTMIVLLGTLKEDSVERYIALHDSIPQQIITNLQSTGVTDLDIYRHDTKLILTIEKAAGAPRDTTKFDKEAEDTWQATTGACFDKKWVVAKSIFDMQDHMK
ncbi:MAG: L-rhamnose mutarotase [Chitinivibrionales bacterium]|nr:L-rhamnose mutarotase [Chitinivibrionales bacterium]